MLEIERLPVDKEGKAGSVFIVVIDEKLSMNGYLIFIPFPIINRPPLILLTTTKISLAKIENADVCK